jgi:hypothetical protein
MDVTYRQWISTGGRADLSGLVGETFDSLAHLVSHRQLTGQKGGTPPLRGATKW